MKALLLPALLLCALGFTACKEKPAPAPAPAPADPGANEPTVSNEAKDYPRMVQTEHAPGTLGSESTGGPVSAKVVDQLFNKVDWDKPENKPTFALETGPADSIHVALTGKATAEAPEFELTWKKEKKVEEGSAAENLGPFYDAFTSPPLTDKDQVSAILESFIAAFEGGEKTYETAVEWTKVEKD